MGGQLEKAEREVEGAAGEAAGRYRLLASLGGGGMADVYLGVAQGRMGFNRLVVVKKLREGLIRENENFVKMFLDEGRLVARLNHPNVIHTYEIGEWEGTYFLAMEYLDGQPISNVVKALAASRKTVSAAVWVKVVADALSGLHYAHELKDFDGTPLGIVHRDVSPQNLFITYDGVVKLVDFGIAKARLNSAQTEVGDLKGKIGYMAPEQAMGEPVDCRADIFSMGVVLWELLSGSRLNDADPGTALNKLLNEPVRSLLDAAATTDPALSAIVMKALAKNAKERYQTAHDMRAALEEWLRTNKMFEVPVADVVTDLFREVRAETQEQIRHAMSQASSPGESGVLNLTLGSLSGLSSGSRSVKTQRRRRRIARGATIGVAAFAAAGLLLWMRAKPATPQVTPTIQIAPAKVSLTIVAAPAGATLFLDGVALGASPFVGTFPRGEGAHELRAEAPGFTPSTRAIWFLSDARYEIGLLALPAPPATGALPDASTSDSGSRPASSKRTGNSPASLPALERDPWK